MKQYLELAKRILEGETKTDRTGVGTIQIFGDTYKCPLTIGEDGAINDFPLLTTKKVFMRGTFEELKWKLSGETNIQSLVKKKVNIWTEWPFKHWLQKTGQFEGLQMFVDEAKSAYTDEWNTKKAEFENLIVKDDAFAKEFGDLGPTYGYHFRRFGEIIHNGEMIRPGEDQLMIAIDKLRNKPEDRRNIISLWDPHTNKQTLLPPCPCFYHFNVSADGEYVDLLLYQRSCDTFLGVPFNTSQDALLLCLVAKVVGRKPRMFTHVFGDAHFYLNHIGQVREQLTREPRPLPQLIIKKETDNILDFEWEDIEIRNYNPHPVIKAPVAV